MRVVETVEEMMGLSRKVKRPSGLVPTMGYLHEGHLSLVRRARKENETLIVSVFVNPAQFGPQEDLDTYPRDLKRDLALLETEGTDVVFAPSVEEMYPTGYDTWVEVGKLAQRLEGAARPGHFRGVATVVAKLFNIVEPDVAVFGQKDAQQALVIKEMVEQLNFPVRLLLSPTVREEDGLAASSRNSYLSPEERALATGLYRSLLFGKELMVKGERSSGVVAESVRNHLLRKGIEQIDYVELLNARDLSDLNLIQGKVILAAAVRIGKTRLIDNLVLQVEERRVVEAMLF